MAVVDKRAVFKKVGYEPHPLQWAFHDSEARFRVACCGRRFGKSTMAARDAEPFLFLPKKRFWIVGPTYDLGEKEFRVIWDDLIIGQKLGRDKRIKKAYNKRTGDMYIEFPWQTRIEVRSADHPENLVGEALDGVIISEAAKQKEETWKRFIRPALTDKRGWATFPTTPEGFNWLHALWQLGQNPDHPLYASWQFPSWENSAVYPEKYDDPEIQDLLRTTSQEWFDQEIAALFTAFVGKIYGEFSESTHVRKHTFNPAWPNYLTIDWGFNNPSAWIEFQVSPQDEVFVWREHYQSGMTVPEHIEFIKQRPNPPGYRLDLAFGDAADPASALIVSRSLVACLTDPMAKDNWYQGITLVKGFLRQRGKEFATTSDNQVLYGPDGKPLGNYGLYVDYSCDNTIKEFNSYRSKEPVKGNNAPELAANVKNHAMDAIRYGLMHLFELGAQSHLTDIYDLDEMVEQAIRERELDSMYVGSGRTSPVDVGLSLHQLNAPSGMATESFFQRGGRF